jgi:hypothetical protein
MRRVSVLAVLLLLLTTSLCTSVSGWASPTCEAGPDLFVTTDQLGGFVLHGMVTDASYYHWDDLSDAAGDYVPLMGCSLPVGPDGQADLALSAGQLSPGAHRLHLAATVLDTSVTGWCGDVAEDEMTLVVAKFVGFLDPIDNDGSSVFRLKTTVPVEFQLLKANGRWLANADCHLFLAKVENQVVGTYQKAVSDDCSERGNTFRYEDRRYEFHLRTKGLSKGTWRLRVTVNGALAHEANISLK